MRRYSAAKYYNELRERQRSSNKQNWTELQVQGCALVRIKHTWLRKNTT